MAITLVVVAAAGCSASSASPIPSTGDEADIKTAEHCVSVKDCKANKPLGATCTDEVPENCNVACSAKGTCENPAADAGAPKADAGALPEKCESVRDCKANKAQNKAAPGSCVDEVPENCTDACDFSGPSGEGVCLEN